LIGDLWIFLKFINEMIISSNENGMTWHELMNGIQEWKFYEKSTSIFILWYLKKFHLFLNSYYNWYINLFKKSRFFLLVISFSIFW
jgi:hypothetical protein